MKKAERIMYYEEWVNSIVREKKARLSSVEKTFGEEHKDEKTWFKIQRTEKFEEFVRCFYCDIDWVISEIETIEDERGLGIFTPSGDPDFNDFLQRMHDSDNDSFLSIKITKENENRKKELLQEFNALKRVLEEKYPSFDLGNIHREDSLGKDIQRMKNNSGLKELELRKILKNFYVSSCDFKINCYKDECLKIKKDTSPDVLEKETKEMEREAKKLEKKKNSDPFFDALIFALGILVLFVIIDILA